MPPPPFPATAHARFRVAGEEFADGFVMDFAVTGETFRTRLELPKPADPGEAFLIFYASFYQEGASESMIETGLSVSAKGWNLLSKINGSKKPAADCLFGNDDPRKKAPVDLIVSFKSQSQGPKMVSVSAAGRSRLDTIANYKPVGRMRLIIAAANSKSGHFGQAGISLQEVDNQQSAAVGNLVWMPGMNMTKKESRLVLIQQTSSGFVCELPPANLAAKP